MMNPAPIDVRQGGHPHILIIVQNLPVPLDRRVWLECQALVTAGYDVSVICPQGPGDPTYTELEGVRLYKYRPPREAAGALGYLREFTYCWLQTARLSVRAWRRCRFDVLQACNPPDTFWALARVWRLRGVRFVFDHHDLNPEVYLSRFGAPRTAAARAQLATLRWLERRTFCTADRVISTNTSYRALAIERGGVTPDHISVVRSGPDTSRMRPVEPDSTLRGEAEHLVVYLGIMGPQDGVDGVLELAERIVAARGRRYAKFALLGFGDCLSALQQQCREMGLEDVIEFTGRAGPAVIARYLSAASLGISPDPLSPLNDVSTMNKTMEYMAFALPVVTYRLREAVVSAGDCAEYVEPGDVNGMAEAVLKLLDDPARRGALGAGGRRRAEQVLDWGEQAATYVRLYDGLTGHLSAPPPTTTPSTPVEGGVLIDVADDAVLRHFAAHRSVVRSNPAAVTTA